MANAEITEKCLKMANNMDVYPTHQDILISLFKNCTFFKKIQVMQDKGNIKYVHKTDVEKGRGGRANADIADEGGRGGWGYADNG